MSENINSNSYHIPVLVNEVIEGLAIKPNGVYLDVTFGGGGHTRAILQSDPTVKVIGFDWDQVALDLAYDGIMQDFPGRLRLVWGNFSHLYKLIKKHKLPMPDGILADFGTSQFQIHNTKGLSFQEDTLLDMRLSHSHYTTTAATIVNFASPDELRHIFWTYGQEPFTKQIVQAIVEYRQKKKFKTTGELVTLIEKIVYHKGKIHPATRVFQALRIVVNHELENIQAFLPAALSALRPGGRLACISFHSLEDRIVKEFYRAAHRGQDGLIIKPECIQATEEEVQQNSSSRSAKLRIFEKKIISDTSNGRLDSIMADE